MKRFFPTLFLAAWLLPLTAAADPMAPSLLELRETEAGPVDVRFKTPLLKPRGVSVRPVFPEHCRHLSTPTAQRDRTALIQRWSMDCGIAGLAGLKVGVTGLGESGTSALVRISLVGGHDARAVLRGDAPSFVVPEREQAQSPLRVAREYLALGFTHILAGADHLLFVFGLLLLVKGRRVLVATVTCFTLGHSVTLSLASLGWIVLPPAPTEALIAFSILVLAIEVARPPAADTLLRRYPWGVAGIFGLLHGLGFAGALADVGLPAGEIPLALVSFNVGIELGQLLFIAALVGVKWLFLRASGGAFIERLSMPSWATGRLAAAYMIGVLAAFWTFERSFAALALFGA